LALLNLANNSIGKIDAEAFQPLASNLHTLIMVNIIFLNGPIFNLPKKYGNREKKKNNNTKIIKMVF
jgi:hypothetical protein